MTIPRPAAWLMLCISLSLPTHAAGQGQSAAAWRQLTLADLDSAYAIIAGNHPAAAAAAGDSAFRLGLGAAVRIARTRAREVTSYEGWLATLRGFAASFSDPHIALGTRLSLSTVRWPGLLVARRGAATIVVSRDSARGPDLPAEGSQLMSCDGIDVERLGRERMGVFQGTWDVAAQRVRNTPYLLVDAGNPFLPQIRRCRFREGEAEREIELQWRSIAATTLQDRVREAAPVGRPGFGVRRVSDGWWISVQSLDSRAKGVLDSVGAHANGIHAAPWVVVDVRGNGGGNSAWATRLANQLVGEERVAMAMRRAERDMRGPLCGTSWRVSPAVEESLEQYMQSSTQPPDQMRRDLDSMRAARAAGRELAPAPTLCPPAAPPAGEAGELPSSRMAGRLVLLTDRACFSSCLLLAALFRIIGAVHVGEATDFSTRYMEVRPFPLPSGLGTFATLQKVAFAAPARLGPFDPEVPYPGRMDDTPGLEQWVQGVIAARR
jgi:hypothetical protein